MGGLGGEALIQWPRLPPLLNPLPRKGGQSLRGCSHPTAWPSYMRILAVSNRRLRCEEVRAAANSLVRHMSATLDQNFVLVRRASVGTVCPLESCLVAIGAYQADVDS